MMRGCEGVDKNTEDYNDLVVDVKRDLSNHEFAITGQSVFIEIDHVSRVINPDMLNVAAEAMNDSEGRNYERVNEGDLCVNYRIGKEHLTVFIRQGIEPVKIFNKTSSTVVDF